MNNRIKVVMIIALVALVSCVSAINISFADPDASVHKDVYIYNGAGVLQGVYNTTSAGVSISSDALIVIKPQYSNPLDDPSAFLTAFIGWVQTNALFLVIIGMLGSLLFVRRF